MPGSDEILEVFRSFDSLGEAVELLDSEKHCNELREAVKRVGDEVVRVLQEDSPPLNEKDIGWVYLLVEMSNYEESPDESHEKIQQ